MLKNGLGRGLASLIPNKLTNQPTAPPGGESDYQLDDEKTEKVRQIDIFKIEANPLQPREHFDYDDLEDLVNSIKKHGILQPLIVTPLTNGRFQLITGERRLKASQILELKTVPCLIRDAQELEKLELSLIENIQRANLNPLEEAKAYKKLIEEFNLTQEEAGERVGKKRATIANTLRLLELPEPVKQALKENKISASHAKAILAASGEKKQLKLLERILKFNLSVRETEGEIKLASLALGRSGKVAVKSHLRAVGQKDLEILEKEDELRKALNTKVTINKKGEGGTVTIDFYSPEELNDLIKKIAKM